MNQIVNALTEDLPESVRSNKGYREKVWIDAKKFYDKRIVELEKEMLVNAKSLAKKYANNLLPENWKSKKDKEISKKLYDELLNQLSITVQRQK